LDCRNKQLREGDIVAVAAGSKIINGYLVHDPDDIRWARLHILYGDKVKYYDKVSARILNVTILIRDEVDRAITI
jgi:hypothetical protein